MFSISSSSSLAVLLAVPLKIMCSRKCAVPFVSSVSNRDPASIQTPTVAVLEPRLDSVATRRPLGSVVTRVSGAERIRVWSERVEMGEACLRKPVFVKVDQLKPGTNGHTLTVKVISSEPVKSASNRGIHSSSSLLARPSRPARIAECLIGDETGSILFTSRNEQDCANKNKHNIWAFI